MDTTEWILTVTDYFVVRPWNSQHITLKTACLNYSVHLITCGRQVKTGPKYCKTSGRAKRRVKDACIHRTPFWRARRSVRDVCAHRRLFGQFTGVLRVRVHTAHHSGELTGVLRMRVHTARCSDSSQECWGCVCTQHAVRTAHRSAKGACAHSTLFGQLAEVQMSQPFIYMKGSYTAKYFKDYFRILQCD